jgi:hypothetical protein
MFVHFNAENNNNYNNNNNVDEEEKVENIKNLINNSEIQQITINISEDPEKHTNYTQNTQKNTLSKVRNIL